MVRLFDITDPTHFKEVINYAFNATDSTLLFEDDISGKKTYYLLEMTNLVR
ncbi:MAG: hypothetical protein R3E08_11695 [Thiotrichaceae bacterium]